MPVEPTPKAKGGWYEEARLVGTTPGSIITLRDGHGSAW